MPEPATILGLSALGAIVAKDVVTRLLGPTADYVGGELKEFTRRRFETVERIFQNAAAKAQDRLDEPGAVPPRVLRDVLNEGSFQDDDLAVEYFGGVLASSRTGMSRDDRAATFTGLISRLSTYQIRSHFILYSIFRDLFIGRSDSMYGAERRRRELSVFLPMNVYGSAMAFTAEELEQIQSIIDHTLWGLYKEDLISDFEYGDNLTSIPNLRRGIVFAPTVLGAEMFLRAHGIQSTSAGDILSSDLNLAIKCEIRILPGSKAAQ
jgi:hypothetical protein